jgi:predicted HTH domain antitoxin
MSHLTIEVPSDVAEALRLPPDEAAREVRKELALALYARHLLPLGKARQLAGLTRVAFEEALGARRIPRAYDDDDLAHDLAYGLGDD